MHDLQMKDSVYDTTLNWHFICDFGVERRFFISEHNFIQDVTA